MNVLVVHRQKGLTKIIKDRLAPWRVQRAHTGLDGLLAARSQKFDLIICELDLPVVTGIEMIRSIRLSSRYKNIPVAVMEQGFESPEHGRLIHLLHGTLISMREVYEMQKLVVDPDYVR